MGGMAALIPSRKDAEANERAIEAVRADKKREAEAGFDGTWVAHPDVVDVAMEEFDAVLGDRPNQIDRQRADVSVSPEPSCSTRPPRPARSPRRGCAATSTSASSTSRSGSAAAAPPGINNLMEDAATAEISRSQIWQWIRHGKFTPRPRRARCSTRRWRASATEVGDEVWEKGRPDETRELFERVALGDDFPEFLTLPAYEYLD